MEKEAAKGIRRNKAQTKQRFLDAIEQILITKGVAALKVNDIAKVAGLDKKLIYKYFGGTEQLMDEYIRTKDFWSNVKGEKVPDAITDGGHAFVEDMLLSQFDYVAKDKAFQKLLLWRLTEQRESLKKLTDAQEANGETLLQSITDPHFGGQSTQFRSIMAVLIAGTYYLDLYAAVNGSVFCGIDLQAEQGRNEIRKALSFLLQSTYKNL
ncbi:TetR/AcrR family transcriptional regulator [Mucilaginibacter sp. Bleaf8]|uniref:TetR/AcrR family transcriptional regulator n=1 Tax=Mucilaginibacter sp. Bleaf8 TaxID=2834430 RepID=UPI001BCEB3F6|nr:TetR/AcrR family transcriptional regulator [Mucilaginibacter sp. Bleaf8]MBS7566941.1 TetR/AcrR family transcriptional regulator [Mucilaginibacter sp. Bleaf8]